MSNMSVKEKYYHLLKSGRLEEIGCSKYREKQNGYM